MRKNGFTFIELSIVMVILAILIAGSMPIGSSILKAAKISSTQDKLDAIESALRSYLITNGNLPCPASLTQVPSDTGFGEEQRSGNACDTSDSGIDDISYTSGVVTHHLIMGAVPVRSLNMTNLSMADGWDNKIVYIVDKNFAEDFDESPIASITVLGTTTGIDDDYKSITIKTGSDESTITSDAVYVLISPGENRSNAYDIEGSVQLNTSGLQAQEDENDNTDEVFVDYVYNQNFDDSVRFKTKIQLISDIDWEDIGCVGVEAEALDDETWANTEYGEVDESSTSTGTCRKCYKYGRWGNAYTTDCP